MAEKIIKRTGGVIGLLLMLVLLLGGIIPVKAEATSQQAGTITVAVEKFTIGQGYYIEPKVIPFYEGDTGATIVDRLLGGPSGYKSTNDGDKGFYLSSIIGADPTGKVEIPRYISEMSFLAPSTEVNNGNKDMPNLGEFAYSSMSGWMYSVNGVFPRVGLSKYDPKDGDVMRLQFTVWAYGGDLGDDYSQDRVDVAKREALTKAIAVFNGREDKEVLLSKSWINEAYENAMSVMADLGNEQDDVDSALSQFERALNAEALTGIQLDNNSLEMGSGSAATLNVIFQPESCSIPEAVHWTTSDMDIVDVDQNGNVTAWQEGTAVITASVGDFTAECTVTVVPKVPLSGIHLSRSQASIGKRDAIALSVKYEPENTSDDKTVIWTSSNENVATVNQKGIVTAHNYGDTIITAKVGDFTDQCKISVIDNGQEVVDEVIRQIKRLNEDSSVSEVAKAQQDFSCLTESQMSLLTDEEKESLQSRLNNAIHYVTQRWAENEQKILINCRNELEADNLTDETLFSFVKSYQDYETLRDLETVPDDDKETILNFKKEVEATQKQIKSINAGSNGVSVLATGLPWTVQVKAETVNLTAEEMKAIGEDFFFYEPQVCSAYKVELRDFGAAEAADSIPQWVVPNEGITVWIPAGEYKKNPLEKQNLTVINGEEKQSLESKAYNAQKHTISIENADLTNTLIFICDSRIPITGFNLTESANIVLDSNDPSLYLSVTEYKPYDTTDKDRIVWSSSNPEVATVDSQGKVTGHTKGETVITADICGIQKSSKVTVKMNLLPDFKSFWPTFRKDNTNMAIVDTKLPNTGENLTEKWIQEGMVSSNLGTLGTPLNINGKLYVSADDYLYCLNKETGDIEKKTKMCGKVGYFSYATYGDGMIFVPIDGGIVEAFNAETLDSLWHTERMGGQSLCQLTYYDGLMYSGTWSGGGGGKGNTGKFYCFDTTKNGEQTGNIKKAKWVSDDQNGYYWSGATIVGDAVIFGGDSGWLQSRNRITGQLIDGVQCEGMIRSCIAYDEGTSSVYFTAGVGDFTGGADEGKVYKVGVTKDGRFTGIQGTQLPAAATTTPVVYNGRIYVPTGKTFEWDGKMSVLDVNTMNIIYNAETGGSSKSSPLLTTAYSDDGQKTVYLYMTVNNMDGAIVRMKDWEGNTTPQVEVIYRPDANQRQHTTASLYCDQDGTIFYYNDQGHLMALTGTTEGVRESLGAVDGRRPGQGGGGSNAAGKAAIQKAASATKDAFDPWKFDGNYVAPSKSVSKPPTSIGEKVKKAAAILGMSALGMAVAYSAGAAMLQLKPGKKP